MPDRLIRYFSSVAVFLALLATVRAQGVVPRAEPVTPVAVVAESGAQAALEKTSTIVDPDRKLQPGDQVSILIVEDNEPAPMQKAVSAAGDLDISPLGSVKVAGMTVAQASSAIRRFLEGDYYYNATVRL